MKKLVATLTILFMPSMMNGQSPYPRFNDGIARAQYLQPIIQSIESTTATSFIINSLIRSIAPRRDWVCFVYTIATDSLFSNSSIIQRASNCMPPIPNCLGRGYLDSAVQFRTSISSLQPNKKYFIRFFSYSLYSDVVFNSPSSILEITLPQVSPPVQPILTLPQAITSSSANICWRQAFGFPTHYGLAVATDSTFHTTLPQYANSAVSDTQTVLTGLLPQTQYFVRVRAVNVQGFSSYSQTIHFQTLSGSSNLFTAENRSSGQGFPSVRSGSEYYRLGTRNITQSQADEVIAEVLHRGIAVIEAWAQDNSTCTPPQQSASELVIRVKEPNISLTAFGFTQSASTWADSCSCKNFRVYSNFPTSTSVESTKLLTSIGFLYPNPATETANISLSLPSASIIRLTLHDALGRELRSVADGVYGAGMQEFSVTLEGLPSAVYFLRCSVGGQIVVRRLAVVR